MRLGAHISTAGGVSHAFDRGLQITAECMQVFTRNQNRWTSKPIPVSEVEAFRRRRIETGIGPNMAHASYLVNLATGNPELAEKSIDAMVDELLRAGQLGIEYLVFHPGSHGGDGVETGIRRISERLDRIIEQAGSRSASIILLENTAGQGTNLGYEFSQLRDMIAMSHYPERLGVCMDTCHSYAAGYDIASPEGYSRTIEELISAVTLEKILAFHLNDSKHPLGSRKDRHEGISKGALGLQAFGPFVNDPRFKSHPAILETPEGETAYENELRLLRTLLR